MSELKKHIRIGTRGSLLAETQANSVQSSLAALHPEIEFSLVKIVSQGDRQHNIPIHQMAGVGVFVKELRGALINGRIDLAVHSLKDMPVETPDGLLLAAVTERLDPRDVLVSHAGKLNELAAGSIIGTGSLRRSSQLLAYRSDLKVKGIRGNIDTRLRKVSSGEVDGIIVAAAAMQRLGWENRITEYLPLEYFLPTPGQGVLGIEIRSEDRDLAELIQPLHHEATWQCITAERAFLQALGGGCATAIACLAMVSADTIQLRGMAAGSNGLLYDSEQGSAMTPEQVAHRLAGRLLKRGALLAVQGAEEP
jgi:hydroxymethylbilane synthase